MRFRTELTVVAGILLVLGAMIAAYPPDSLHGDTMTGREDDDASDTSLGGMPLLEAPIGLIRAENAALQGRDDAVVVGVELDSDDGYWGYEIELDSGIEVKIDATTGEYRKTEVNFGSAEDDEAGLQVESGTSMDRETND